MSYYLLLLSLDSCVQSVSYRVDSERIELEGDPCYS